MSKNLSEENEASQLSLNGSQFDSHSLNRMINTCPPNENLKNDLLGFHQINSSLKKLTDFSARHLEQLMREFNAKILTLQIELQKSQNQMKNLSNKQAQLKGQLTEKQQQIEILQQDLHDQKKLILKMKQEEIEKLTKKNQEQQLQINDYKQKSQLQQKELKNMENNIEAKISDLKQAEKLIIQLKQQLFSSKKQNSWNIQEIQHRKKELEKLKIENQKQVRSMEIQRQNMKIEQKSFQQKNKELQNKMQEIERQITEQRLNFDSKVTDLMNDFSTNQKDLQKAKLSLKNLQSRLEKEKLAPKVLLDGNLMYIQENSEMRKQLKDSQSKRVALIQERDELRFENTEQRDNIMKVFTKLDQAQALKPKCLRRSSSVSLNRKQI